MVAWGAAGNGLDDAPGPRPASRPRRVGPSSVHRGAPTAFRGRTGPALTVVSARHRNSSHPDETDEVEHRRLRQQDGNPVPAVEQGRRER